MTSKRPKIDSKYPMRSNGVVASPNKNSENLGLGDMIWIKLHGSSWWPAQVVDDSKSLSKKIKPKKRSAEEVLVRLYGSYTYRYVNPVTSRSEFENILRKNDRNRSAILENTLQKELARLRSESAKGNKVKSKDGMQSDGEENNTTPVTTPVGKSPEPSARRVKVMQSLGLVAPDGSPYIRKDPRV